MFKASVAGGISASSLLVSHNDETVSQREGLRSTNLLFRFDFHRGSYRDSV